jgi:hypothetical protein
MVAYVMGGYERWVAKLVARLLASAALWFESRHLSKIQNANERHKQKSGQCNQACLKIYKKNYTYCFR